MCSINFLNFRFEDELMQKWHDMNIIILSLFGVSASKILDETQKRLDQGCLASKKQALNGFKG